MLLGEPMLAAQDALDFETFFQIIAGENELCGFSGRKDAAVAALL